MLKDFKEVIIDVIKDLPYIIIAITVFSSIYFIIYFIKLKFGYLAIIAIVLVLIFLVYMYIRKKSLSLKAFIFRNTRLFILIGILSVVGLIFELTINGKSLMERQIETKLQKNVTTNTIDGKKKLYQYKNADIQERILMLKSSGLTKDEIVNKLKNNMEFRQFIKNGDEKLNVLLKDQKDKVDN